MTKEEILRKHVDSLARNNSDYMDYDTGINETPDAVKTVHDAMSEYAITQKIELLQTLYSEMEMPDMSRYRLSSTIERLQQQLKKLQDGK